jgi:hypothetical protein
MRLHLSCQACRVRRSNGIAPVLSLVFLCLSSFSADWKPPENPKDDKHWYPEMPETKEPNDTLINGTFEEKAEEVKGYPPRPKGWAHPDDFTSFWTDDPERGKVIKIDTDVLEVEARKRQAAMRDAAAKQGDVPAAPTKSAASNAQQYDVIGATYGVSYYSEKFKCKPKQAYKISFDYKGPSGGAKVWVRGWGTFNGEERRRWEAIVNCRTAGEGWRHFEQPFHPTRRPIGKDKETGEQKVVFTEVSHLRVMLYAYWPRGQYHFDNIKVEEITDAEYERLKEIPAEAK